MLRNLFYGVFGLTFSALALAGPVQPIVKAQSAEEFQNHPHYDYYAVASHPPGRLRAVEQYHLNQAIDSLKNDKIDYAYGDTAFILLWFPNHPKALMLVAEEATRSKKPQIAEQHFRNALELYPNHAQTHMIYGIYQAKIGAHEKAIESYKRAIELDPNYAEAHYNLGLAYYHSKKYNLANTHAQTAYGMNYPLPGLQRLLKAKKAWSPGASAATSDPAAGEKDKVSVKPDPSS